MNQTNSASNTPIHQQNTSNKNKNKTKQQQKKHKKSVPKIFRTGEDL